MPKKKSFRRAACPVARPLGAVGDSWSLLIVRDAFEGVRRFSEFQRSLGVAKSVLAARLRNLVAHGIFDLEPASAEGSYRQYALTTKGRALFTVVVALRQWGEEHFFAADETHVLLVDRKRHLPVRRLQLRSQDGRVLDPEDTLVERVGGQTSRTQPTPSRTASRPRNSSVRG